MTKTTLSCAVAPLLSIALMIIGLGIHGIFTLISLAVACLLLQLPGWVLLGMAALLYISYFLLDRTVTYTVPD